MMLPIPEGNPVVTFRVWSPNGFGKPVSPVSNTIGVDNVSFMPNLKEDFEGGKLAWGDEETGLQFTGNGMWEFDWTESHEGEVSLRTPKTLKAGQWTSMKFEVIAPRRGADIDFYYLCQAQMPFDKFMFKIDGEIMLSETRVTNEWQEYFSTLAPGKHELEWKYFKEANDNGNHHPGKGGVWIDDIRIINAKG